MSNEKPLSERVRYGEFDKPTKKGYATYAVASDGPLADEIAALEKRLAEAPDVQYAIDAAMESVAKWLIDTADEYPHNDYEKGQQFQNQLILEHLRSRIGHNPLAEAKARIAELESYIGYRVAGWV